MPRRKRPDGLTEEEAFRWYMPGDPPPAHECWDWAGGSFIRGGYGYVAESTTADARQPRARMSAHVIAHRIFNPGDPTTQDKPFVLHSCDRPTCCQPAHLHAGDQAQNMREKVERGRSAVGERHPQAKLTDADVRWIRSQPDMSTRALAAQVGVSPSQVRRIRRGDRWPVGNM